MWTFTESAGLLRRGISFPHVIFIISNFFVPWKPENVYSLVFLIIALRHLIDDRLN